MFRKKYDGQNYRPLKKARLNNKVVLKKKYTGINIRKISELAKVDFSFHFEFSPQGILAFIRNYSVILGIILVLLITLLGTGIYFFTGYLNTEFEKVQALTEFQPNVVTKIYDKNGILISELFKQKREVVPREDIPEDLINAFIAMEDRDFYTHLGVNPEGIVRAFFINVASGRVKQGGSTITQQLAKILLTSRRRNLTRKIKEAFIALMIDATYEKDRILTLYLNQIFLGHGAYGVEAASNLYFNKSVRELSFAECTLLATLPSAPNRYSPIRHPKRSMILHKTALAKMVDLGYATIPEAEKAFNDFWSEYTEYIQELPPSFNTWSLRVDEAPWVTEYIRRQIVENYGEDAVYNEGLTVYTTFDLTKQKIASELLEKRLIRQTAISGKRQFKNEDYFTEKLGDQIAILSLLFDVPTFSRQGSYEDKKINDAFQKAMIDEFEFLNYFTGLHTIAEFMDEYRISHDTNRYLLGVEGALVSIDQSTGAIETMVGGSEFSSINQLNRAVQSYRQPGSSIKPLLYTAAIESRKFTPATTVLDAPLIYLNSDGGAWIPENYEGEYYGEMRLRSALAKSINVISIRIAEELGMDTVIDYYSRFLHLEGEEKDRRIPRNLSIALGTTETTPLEMARSYAIIANGGKEVIPYAIRYIEDRDGNVLENREEEVKEELATLMEEGKIQIIQPATAEVMISLMRSVIQAGTGRSADPGRPAGGKTGTTNNWKDAWFVGYTPELTTCIWVGYDKLGMSLGRGQTGGSVAAPLWGEYMREALKGVPVKSFPVYAQLERAAVTNETGLKPGPGCTNIIEEIFIPGTIPTEIDTTCRVSRTNREIQSRAPTTDLVTTQEQVINRERSRIGDDDIIIDDLGEDLLD
jgi:penicillin-binding protein 1A